MTIDSEKKTGHTRLDVLKLSVEGSEFALLKLWLEYSCARPAFGSLSLFLTEF